MPQLGFMKSFRLLGARLKRLKPQFLVSVFAVLCLQLEKHRYPDRLRHVSRQTFPGKLTTGRKRVSTGPLLQISLKTLFRAHQHSQTSPRRRSIDGIGQYNPHCAVSHQESAIFRYAPFPKLQKSLIPRRLQIAQSKADPWLSARAKRGVAHGVRFDNRKSNRRLLPERELQTLSVKTPTSITENSKERKVKPFPCPIFSLFFTRYTLVRLGG